MAVPIWLFPDVSIIENITEITRKSTYINRGNHGSELTVQLVKLVNSEILNSISVDIS